MSVQISLNVLIERNSILNHYNSYGEDILPRPLGVALELLACYTYS